MDKLLEEIAVALFDIWKEAKSTCENDWDDVTWDSLPENHKKEYLLTAKRILSKVQEYYASLVGEEELLTDEELDNIMRHQYRSKDTVDKVVAKAQAAKSKAVNLARTPKLKHLTPSEIDNAIRDYRQVLRLNGHNPTTIDSRMAIAQAQLEADIEAMDFIRKT